jgi:pimeloyl-ACP methyl ester carboxylesterase
MRGRLARGPPGAHADDVSVLPLHTHRAQAAGRSILDLRLPRMRGPLGRPRLSEEIRNQRPSHLTASVFARTLRTHSRAGGAVRTERSRRRTVDMRRWTLRILVGLCGLIVVTALTGATYQWLATRKDLAATPPPGHLVDIGGYRLHLWCTGDGAPAVILDTGLGGSSASWGFVQPDVARFTRVCSYDRAGMGYSDPGPTPRTARRIANELAELLVRSGIGGPVVLVGASIAGLNVRVFASDHPERAAGLVLVDASHEDQVHEVPPMARFVPLLSTIGVLRLFGVSFGQRIESLPPSVRQFARATSFRAAGYQAAADEIIHVRESASEVRSSRRKLTVPVLVITAGRGADENWRQLQRDQASLSERGCLMIAEQSGHVVPIDQPELIVDAIRIVVETARGHDVPLCAPPANVERDRPQ